MIASLMMEAVRTSESSVYINETTGAIFQKAETFNTEVLLMTY
jgi:hypothetical protein